MKREYHWHKHDNDDEFFFVLSGRLIVDLEERFGRPFSAWSRLPSLQKE
jgi:mannose-6-phosphate isomerase-like protein (cupin superfamily)